MGTQPDIKSIILVRQDIKRLRKTKKGVLVRCFTDGRYTREWREYSVLMNNHFVESEAIKDEPFDTKNFTAKVFISDAGRQYLSFLRDRTVSRWATPIIVSVITNLVIAGIKWLLPLVLLWIANFRA